jgi:hypothetical protein
MNRYVVTTAATAALVVGGGVALGQEGGSSRSVPPRAMQTPTGALCEQVRQQVVKDNPGATLGDCNAGENEVAAP